MKSDEIAKLAGVSRSTVSRVLNHYTNVPEATRVKVQNVIDQYGYTPNQAARALAGTANDIIELVIADIDSTRDSSLFRGASSPYFLETIYFMINAAKEKGLMVLVNVITNPKDFNKIRVNFQTKMIKAGIIIGFPYGNSDVTNWVASGYNVIAVDNFTRDEISIHNAKAINSDNFEGGKMATSYLISKGHKKIGFIEGDSRLSAIERKNGYLSAMNEAGYPIMPNTMIKANYNEEMAYTETKKLLKSADITALFCSNDIMAMGAIKAIEEEGLRVPEDISIVGFDNHDFSKFIKHKITSVYIDLEEVAKKCVDSVFEEPPFIKFCIPKISEGTSTKAI